MALPIGGSRKCGSGAAKVVGHAFGIAPLRQRALDDDPVIAGENASDLALVPLGQQLHAHSGIIQLGAEVRSSGGFRGLAPAGEV